MTALRLLLSILLLIITAYPTVTVINHGWSFVPIFFGDLAAMGWRGQFNIDFG